MSGFGLAKTSESEAAGFDDDPYPDLHVERRRFARVSIALPGRFLLADGREHNCMTIDVAPNGVRLKASLAPRPGAHVIAYIEKLGRLEGAVARVMPDGFSLAIASATRRTKRFNDRINRILRGDAIEAAEQRLHPRLESDGAISVTLFHQGQQRVVELLDITNATVAFRTDTPLRVGEQVAVGVRTAVVTRVFAGGASAQFV